MPKLHKSSILNKITASNGVYALHRFNFPLKIEIVTNIIKFYSLFVHFSSVFNLSLQKYSFDF